MTTAFVRDAEGNIVAVESAGDQWATPPDLFRLLDQRFHFQLDVCASAGNAKCERFYSLEDDGLRQRWAPWVCWANPPYSNWAPWVEKAYREAQRGAVVVVLVPPWTDRAAWHEWSNRADRRVELRGRIQFLDPGPDQRKRNQHPSALLIFDPFQQFPDAQIGTLGPPVFGWDWRSELQAGGHQP